jgi:hypothetical protein
MLKKSIILVLKIELLCCLPSILKIVLDVIFSKFYSVNDLTKSVFENPYHILHAVKASLVYFLLGAIIYSLLKLWIKQFNISVKIHWVGILYSAPIVFLAWGYMLAGTNPAIAILYRITIFYLLGVFVGYIDKNYIKIFEDKKVNE